MPEYAPMEQDEGLNVHDVLDGTVPIDLSHAGGEFQQLLEEDLRPKTKKRMDTRTRHNRVLLRNQGFTSQLEGMVDAYLNWCEAIGVSGKGVAAPLPTESVVQGSYLVQVVDVYETYQASVPLLEGSQGIAASLIEQGLLPSAPYTPTVAFTTRAMELYRTSHLRCPHLAIQPFVKGLCDLHAVPFRPYLSRQFSIAYDLYLSIRGAVDARVQAALERDTPEWRLKHACPACTHKLHGEDQLIFDMLVTMDGNDSLKRILRRGPAEEDEDGELAPGVSRELRDDRQVGGDYYLSRERVDKWAKELLEEMLPAGKEADEGEELNPCADRWKNMVNELTARMWGIFDETGAFLALCRHGFVLVVADMVQSGELAKYPLSVVESLLDAFGARIGGGYDIGCKFGKTLDRSVLGPLARDLEYTALVGSFHGHAHNRLCQLSFLAKYVKGMGLEDLEGCERFFSKSNALAPSVRYASVFHRKQRIHEFIKHMDKMDTYQNLSEFLINNYKQAIDLINGQPALDKQMADQHVASVAIFEQWLAEEREYLQGLSKEPLQETLQMEYYQRLVNLDASQKTLDAALAVWFDIIPETHGGRDFTASKETQRRHALENHQKDTTIVQGLETKLGIVARWTPMSAEWGEAATMVTKRRYQRCLDTLEGLVVSRMFELTKMNMSQTGYKLRKHIGNALKARSQAVRTALEKYNAAAKALSPPRAELSWDMVVEYAFLADFDLLSDTREDVRERPWATPAARILMDQYFNIQRAHEEIKCLNIEIPRLVTYIRDEEAFLKDREDVIGATDSALAHQITMQRERLERFNALHMRRLRKLARLRGFTGSLVPGTSIESTPVAQDSLDVQMDGGENLAVDDGHGEVDAFDNGGGDGEDDDDDDGDGDNDDDMLAELAHAVLQIASDI
ncbi:hypothetical protein Hypma_012873 [Hypsizygus marmoreus]|uniref:CxC1-like cysteine cluster associated with KDZ transposases domain-containing protein n=1 Tax=Hypsizygus marmoreus TaxID=39966 RepID=A0A369JL04_HYPMA|nr:hypothetical protein Hypma_012873 [Hypsizygus marmoreus]